MKTDIKLKNNKQKGLTILFAVIVSVFMVSIVATITSIAIRQTILSSTGRESQYAFYAANTGIECARYWDWKGEIGNKTNEYAFPVNGYGIDLQKPTPDQLSCAGKDIKSGNYYTEEDFTSSGWWVQSGNKTTFKIALNPKDDQSALYCALVTVEKIPKNNPSPTELKTQVLITSRGYNNCDITNPKTVERGLEMYYEQ